MDEEIIISRKKLEATTIMNDNNVNGDNNNNNNINGVIDEFDLSEADSEIEDDVIVKKKTN